MNLYWATPADAPQLAPLFDLYRQFYNQPPNLAAAEAWLAARLQALESAVLVAAQQQPVGLVQLYPSFSSVSLCKVWQLNDLFVLPTHRNQGVAQKLLQAVAQQAPALGYSRLQLETHQHNSPAQRLYERLGWQRNQSSYFYEMGLQESL